MSPACALLRQFQSHAGSIEALTRAIITPAISRCFNPTLVRLRHNPSLIPEVRDACFNPTLVRLRPACARSGGWGSCWFQSHAGSIEAPEPSGWRTGLALLFQSHAGSIEASGFPCVFRSPGRVSIPRWFD